MYVSNIAKRKGERNTLLLRDIYIYILIRNIIFHEKLFLKSTKEDSFKILLKKNVNFFYS